VSTTVTHNCELCNAGNAALLHGFNYDAHGEVIPDSLEDAKIHLCGRCIRQINELERVRNESE
jgi:hypothetical protein